MSQAANIAALGKTRSCRRRARLIAAGAARTGAARAIALLAMVLTLVVGASTAQAQNRQVTISASSDIYAGLPFTLMVSARGFAEEPTPEIADFEIPGCTITFAGVSPNVSTSVSIFNGRRSESRTVEFVYRYRILPEKAGNYRLPVISVSQGKDSASSRPATFKAADVATTREMRVELALPERPVTVGETFDVTLDWLLRKNPQDHEFSVPLFDAVEWVDVHQPKLSPIRRRNDALTFSAGDRELTLPYTQTDEIVDGLKYTRLRFVVSMTPIKAGTLSIPATRVVAGLQVGTGRDTFGFPVARTQLFKAEDKPRTLEIQPLPLAGRPASFANAIGTAYSIQVRAERTVVELGEPLELEITIRGDGRLEGLSLPRIDGLGGLPPDQFTVSDTLPAGEIVDLGQDSEGETIKGKRFRVTARIKSPDVTGVPPLPFSFYNPASKQYQTVKSEPIALSVANRGVVGGNQVVRADKNPSESNAGPANGQGAGAAAESAQLGSLVGADLSLSAGAHTMTRSWAVSGLGWPVYLFYALPLLFLMFRIWQLGTRARREDRGALRRALRAAGRAIDDAATTPAREAGPQVISALRALAKTVGHERLRDGDVIARIENESYRPDAGERPMAADLTDAARKLAEQLAAEGRSAGRASRAGIAAAVLVAPVLWLCATVLYTNPAHAQTPVSTAVAPVSTPAASSTTLDAARTAYQEALSQSAREARTAGFARSERMFRELVERTPDNPELVTDWGNAALGAQEFGRATLAYRRAMAQSLLGARSPARLAAQATNPDHERLLVLLAPLADPARAPPHRRFLVRPRHALARALGTPAAPAAPAGHIAGRDLGRHDDLGAARQSAGGRCGRDPRRGLHALGQQPGRTASPRQTAARRCRGHHPRDPRAVDAHRAGRRHRGLGADQRGRTRTAMTRA
jgi:hypothetical protein